MIRLIPIFVIFTIVMNGCAGSRSGTLKNLRNSDVAIKTEKLDPVKSDVVRKSYKEFIDEAPSTNPNYKKALNRLADLEMAEGDKKTMGDQPSETTSPVNVRDANAQENYLKAIAFYEHLVETDPTGPKADWTLYQLSRAYEQSGRLESAATTMERLIQQFPRSSYYIEGQFRLGELHFTLLNFDKSEQAYLTVIRTGKNSAYYERSLYKYGWSLFKQDQYQEALDAFFSTLKVLPLKYDGYERLVLKDLNRLDQEMVSDIFRAINLCFSYSGGIDAANRYLSKNKHGSFEYEIYSRLGNYFIESARTKDGADAYGAFVARQPLHPLAPEFQLKRIEAYTSGGLLTLAIDARKEYARMFGRSSEFWRKSGSEERRIFSAQLKRILIELSEYYHARAQQTKTSSDYNEAIQWYVQLATSFPGEETIEQKFLLAELLYQIQRYYDSIKIYEQIAYELPKHPKSADSGYSALLGYDKLIASDTHKREEWINEQIKSAMRFVAWFPDDKRTLALQVKSAEQLFELKRYDEVLSLIGPFMEQAQKADRTLLSSVYVLLGHIAFERKNYAAAQDSYQKALQSGKPSPKIAQMINERIAVASYKRAESVSLAGNTDEAIKAFLQAAQVAPNDEIRSQAEYDAAAGYLQVQNWSKGIELLEAFRAKYPQHKLTLEVTKKLAFSYEKLSRFDSAAGEIKKTIAYEKNPETRRALLWSVAEMYEKGFNIRASIGVYTEYVNLYSSPAVFTMEAIAKIAADEKAQRNGEAALEWNRKQVSIYRNVTAGERNDRIRYLAAASAYEIALHEQEGYRNVRLTSPLKKSLKRKQELMKTVLSAYDSVAEYGVAEFATAATFQVGQIYHHLGQALIGSEKPKNLSSAELEEYDLMLEEQAYPFEEKAIEMYEINAQRMRNGIYDDWVKNSIAALAQLQPARYAKVEKYETVVDVLY